MDKSRRIILEKTENFPQLVYDYIKGKVSAQDVLDNSMVNNIIENPNRVKSIFQINLDGNELVDYFNLEEFDDFYLSRFIDGGSFEYESPDYMDDRLADDDFFIGDYFDRYSEEYQMILELYRRFNEDFTPYMESKLINNTILNSYSGEINQILDLIYEYQNEEYTEKVRDEIWSQLNGVLGPAGISIDTSETYSNYFRVSIPAGYLFYLMTKYPNRENEQSDSASINSAMNGLTRGKDWGGWEEEKWNFDISDFKKNPRFVSESNQMITNLIEKVNEDVSPERTELLTKILNQFGMGKSINVPQKNMRFTISHYDSPSNKLIIYVQNVPDGRYSDLPIRRWGSDEIRISPQAFYNWYNNYELALESKNILLSLRKILSHDSQ